MKNKRMKRILDEMFGGPEARRVWEAESAERHRELLRRLELVKAELAAKQKPA
jgi:hypothetical protein